MSIQNFTFLSGAELADGTLFIGAQSNDPEILDITETPHTLIRQRTPDGEWIDVGSGDWISTGVCPNATNDGISFLGPDGEFLDLRQDGHTRNEVLAGKDSITTTLRFLKPVDGITYAGGTNNYIFRFNGKDWEEFGSAAMRDAPAPRSFDNIAGFSAAELYAFGWEGALWTNTSGTWEQIASPTNLILHDGEVHGPDVFIGGQLGTILKGRDNVWEVIPNDILQQDIWSVRSFGDAVYFSMASGIMRLQDGDLALIKQLGPDMRTAMSLFVGPSGLWSVGASDIVLFDGDEWHTIAQSD